MTTRPAHPDATEAAWARARGTSYGPCHMCWQLRDLPRGEHVCKACEPVLRLRCTCNNLNTGGGRYCIRHGTEP